MDEIDIFLEEFEQESGLMTPRRLEIHTQAIMLGISHNGDDYADRAADIMKMIQVLALVSIAKSLGNMEAPL